MQAILFFYKKIIPDDQSHYFNALKKRLLEKNFQVIIIHRDYDLVDFLKKNPRIVCVINNTENNSSKYLTQCAELNPILPVITISDYRELEIEKSIHHIVRRIHHYIDNILPPFTKALMKFVKKNDYCFSTPGHQGGEGFQKSPIGTVFYDFYGPSIFQSDISTSVFDMGSLLEHTKSHHSAEQFIAETFHADRSLIVTNGTSTSNKIVGMYAAADGDTVLIDRNCHKSITHFMMMVDVHPIYLKQSHNSEGIIGGIPENEFDRKSIQKKLDDHPTAKKYPDYAVITNSTYDGILYNVEKIKKQLDMSVLHFDAAWIPYALFHPIYEGKYGMCSDPKNGKTIFETQSTHKLLAAFSQTSLIHVKGKYDEARLNESYMMHTTTSPFYPLVASNEIAAAMMRGTAGLHLMQESILGAIEFRNQITKLFHETDSWFYRVWQPEKISDVATWPLFPDDKWHGFSGVGENHLFLDPIKITLLLPGIENGKMLERGIPAAIVSLFLEDHRIIVEKNGPYSMLFLFGMGVTRDSAKHLWVVLNKFKKMFDENQMVKKVLPSLYEQFPKFYNGMRIQTLAENQHKLMCDHRLAEVMDHAFDQFPEFVITPHQAYQQLVKQNTKAIPLEELMGHVSAVMILPYPPGIPLIMLEDLGKQFPGFEVEIHGLEKRSDGKLCVRVIC
ncbi:MAG: lysine decarboxylase LdcC [Gammaproteobacteria bacterium]|nr:lysine decarboxylase LdcC [Gammaproteobacteria bacterium]